MKTPVIMIVVLTLFLGGCSISPEEIEKANKLCEPNGGLKQIDVFTGLLPNVACANGAYFTDINVNKK